MFQLDKPMKIRLLALVLISMFVCSVRAEQATGDLNRDGQVDAQDLQVLAENWLQPTSGPGDLDGDQSVGMPDFALLAENWRLTGRPVIVINEIHQDPDIKTELVEFVELYNAGTIEVDLTGWHFSNGIAYEFPAGTTLAPGGYIIVAQSPSAIHAKWSSGRFGIDPDLVYGPFEGKLKNGGETVELSDADGQAIDEVDYQLAFPWPTVGAPGLSREPGSGYSMQLVNPYFDNDLAGSWRSAYPTPAARNTGVYADNIPPHIRQVKHSPKQPQSGDVVTITAKVTDPDGVASVMLLYQLVNPGHYIRIEDAEYTRNWTSVQMHDDGLAGDAVAADDIYTVQLAGHLQTHRRLVRYRIVVVDTHGLNLLVPYPDDTQPNFAYFVYDGVPAWRGAVQPGITPVIEFSAGVMRSLPVYHLIAKKTDIENCTWFEKYGGSEYKWPGTLVYEDEVYDHIRFRARGGVWRYAMGKNMWKFNFNRGHRFQARDDYGKKYKSKWDKLNFSACIQQGSFGQRGEHGMFEALSNKLFEMAGVPTSKTNWVHFRVIDESDEDGTLNAAHPPLTSSGTQYDGDFWGVYMTLEQMDGRFLDEHDLPDGNLYKMDQAYPNGCKLNNQGPTGATDKSDVLKFRSDYQSASSADWWGSNVNLEAYYGLYAIYHAVHHGDITSKNHFFYLNPEPTTNEWGTNNLWWQLVWDVDLTWTCYYSSMKDPFQRSGILNHSVINIACKNRVRELVDLLFNPDQTNQLIDEYAAIIDEPESEPSIVDADRAMWDYHWVMGDGAYPTYLSRQASFKAKTGRFYEEAEERGYTRSFPGMVQVMKDFVVERMSHMNSISSDSAIPRKPTVTATCPATFPSNALTFETSGFSDPQGSHTFAAMKWRIAQVAPWSQITRPDELVVLIDSGQVWRYFKGTQEPSPSWGQWREIGFDDSSWLQGQTPIDYGDNDDNTRLDDMRYHYSSVYLRQPFTITDLSAVGKLSLDLYVDDGCIVWINGIEVGRYHVSGGDKAHDDSSGGNHESVWEHFILPEPYHYLREGTNVIAIHALNQSLSNSSDFSIDVKLYYNTGDDGGGPGPGTAHRFIKPGKYEIDPVWESEELTDFDATITIPASEIREGRTYRVRCRMKDNTGRWSHWSQPIQFEAGEPLAAGILEDLRITEVMYNPADSPAGDTTNNDDFEFVELKNVGDEILDLAYVSFDDGIGFDFADSDVNTLTPGQFVLVVKNRAAFQSRYGAGLADRIAGEYTGRLANGGEQVRLIDLWNGTIAAFEYNDGRGWPLSADGAGHSMVPLNAALPGQPAGSLNYGGNWRASAYIGGSPGRDDPEPATNIVLNEIMAHTTCANPQYPEYESNDWIELYNAGDTSTNLHNWYLSDDTDELKKWPIPAVEIAAHSRLSFDEITGFHNPLTSGFGLNKAGEEVILSYLAGTAKDRVVDCARFKGQENLVSYGRYPDGGAYWLHMPASRDSANTKPLSHVVIDELMYHPADVNDEYIELYNPTGRHIVLENAAGSWRLDGGVDYTFPAGAALPAGGRLIVVNFDPHAETARLSNFAAAYGTRPLTPGVHIVGPWSGNLSNRGESVALEKPEPPDQPGDLRSWIIVDEVIYGDVLPWPQAADGTGEALQRVSAEGSRSGNDPANWHATLPTPGNAP
jgi:hypothetical protein